ncbi:MAG: glycosyltransferase [Actinomycetota bacterium]|nr:glycosyltransferase [Actinomycetota bacterium]
MSRKDRLRLPRVIWGLTPIINIKYWSAAVRMLGYESTTIVWGWFDINRREDFDLWLGDFLSPWRTKILDPVREQLMFLWALRHADIFVFFFDGGFLSRTPLRRLESRLLHFARKKIIVTPYGSDIAVVGYLGAAEEAILTDYPQTLTRSRRVASLVRHFCEEADLVIRNLQVGYLPRYDVVWPCQLAVDTDLWRPVEIRRDTSATVNVVHASNHRAIKGTRHVIEAVAELGAEGLPVRLHLLEARPNEEVREVVLAGDIVVEQLIGGFGLFGIEAMSAGKPVLSNLRWMPPEMKAHPSIQECPIVDCDASDIKAKLRDLAENPEARVAAGAASRRFALKYHSYDAVGRAWSVLLRSVWDEVPLEEIQAAERDLPWQLATSPMHRVARADRAVT